MLAALAERRRAEPLEGGQDAAEKEERLKRMMDAQKPKEKGKWKWVLQVALVGYVFYQYFNSAKATPVPMRPSYPK